MSKMMKLEVKGKEYLIGFSNRASVLKAEKGGLLKILKEMENAPTEATAKLVQLGMLEKQPKITVEECNQILNDYIEEHTTEEESADVGQITKYILEQFQTFSGAPNEKKKVIQLPIVEV